MMRDGAPALVLAVLFCTASAFINSFSQLRCDRADKAAGPSGTCSFERGSALFASVETFAVAELERATVEPAGSTVAYRDRDGPGERVTVFTKADSYRFLDNDEWSHEQREEVAARINTFIQAERASLDVKFDRRLALFARALGAALALGGASVWLKRRRA